MGKKFQYTSAPNLKQKILVEVRNPQLHAKMTNDNDKNVVLNTS